MLKYCLKNTLIPSEESQWEELALRELGENVHPNRVRGFCLAREAVRNCLSSVNILTEIKNLQLLNFSTLRDYPDLTISLSHSSTWGAAVLASREIYSSVGIDVEPVERVVKPMILERISHPQDQKLKPLEIWALKEAIFKAAMNTGQFAHPIEFSSLRIDDGTWKHDDSKIIGEWKLEECEGQLVALAWIRT